MKDKKELYSRRPTSPHLSIYSKQISSVLSIFHRMTGMLLFGALSLLLWLFILLILADFDISTILDNHCLCWIKACGYIISYAFFYHISTGVRHLIWDTGSFLSKKALHITGVAAIASSIILTILFWTVII